MSSELAKIFTDTRELERVKVLTLEVESLAAVIDFVIPNSRFFLYGSLARKILGINRSGAKTFKYNSDGDAMMELLVNAVSSFEEEVVLREKLIKEVSGRIGGLNLDWQVVSPFSRKDSYQWKNFNDMQQNGEGIIIYEIGNFSIPWQYDKFKPELPPFSRNRYWYS